MALMILGFRSALLDKTTNLIKLSSAKNQNNDSYKKLSISKSPNNKL